MHKKKLFIYPCVDWKIRVLITQQTGWNPYTHGRWLLLQLHMPSTWTGKVRFPFWEEFRKCYLIQSPHLAPQSFHIAAVLMPVSLLQKNLPGAWIRAKGDSNQSTQIRQRYLGLCSFITSSTRYKEKASQTFLILLQCLWYYRNYNKQIICSFFNWLKFKIERCIVK